jgi:hypothetical protein
VCTKQEIDRTRDTVRRCISYYSPIDPLYLSDKQAQVWESIIADMVLEHMWNPPLDTTEKMLQWHELCNRLRPLVDPTQQAQVALLVSKITKITNGFSPQLNLV